MSGSPSPLMSRNMTVSPQSRGGAASGLPSSSTNDPAVQETGEKRPRPSLRYKKSRSPRSTTSAAPPREPKRKNRSDGVTSILGSRGGAAEVVERGERDFLNLNDGRG